MAAPQLGSRASSERAWRLRAARHSQEEAGPLGAQPLPRLLEPAASQAAHSTAFDPAGTELTGFTRLLAGKEDELMDVISTVVVKELGHDKTRGFPVINRPWTLLKWLERADDFAERITEDYVYIAETDHLMRYAIPNRATPNLNVAFFFPYMSPKDPKCGGVAQKWLPSLQPSPLIFHPTLNPNSPLTLSLTLRLSLPLPLP